MQRSPGSAVHHSLLCYGRGAARVFVQHEDGRVHFGVAFDLREVRVQQFDGGEVPFADPLGHGCEGEVDRHVLSVAFRLFWARDTDWGGVRGFQLLEILEHRRRQLQHGPEHAPRASRNLAHGTENGPARFRHSIPTQLEESHAARCWFCAGSADSNRGQRKMRQSIAHC